MNYTYLHVFYTVAKLQNITKAAEELGVTQPAISRIISNIEKQYNTKLFFRGKNGVKLTREGNNLYEMIKFPLMDLEKTADNIRVNSKLGKTTIHIGATSTALSCYLFKHLDNFKNLFPNVNFRIYSNSSTKLLQMVDEGSIDFAFITTPHAESNNLEIHNIDKINDILIAPTSYKGQIEQNVSIKNLSNYPFIFLSKEMQFREYIDSFLRQCNINIVPTYETDSSAILVPFVELGYGLTFIPDEMVKKLINEGKCFQVNIKEQLPNRFIAFAIKKDKVHSPIIKELKKDILENIA